MREKPRAVVVLGLALLAAVPSAGLEPGRAVHQYYGSTWTTENGLPHNNVVSLAQTREGYLWIGTWEGLLRYDGVRFDLYDRGNTPALRGNRIAALHVDGEGRLWIGTDAGIAVYSDGAFAHYGTDHGLADPRVTVIESDPAGRVWVGTLRGLSRFEAGRFTSYGTEDGLPSLYIWSAAGDGDGLWVGTYGGGLARLRGEAVVAAESLPALAVSALRPTRDGAMWIGTSDAGLFRRDETGAVSRHPSAGALASEEIQSLLEDRDGNLWIGTGAGLERLGERGLSDAAELIGGQVLALLEDREGNLWVGSRPDGLARFSDVSFTTFTRNEGLSGDQTTALVEDSSGALWIGTRGQGVNRWAGGEVKAFSTGNGLSHDVVLSLAEGADGDLWVGTRTGIDRIRGDRVSRVSAGDDVWALAAAPDGSIWIGSLAGASRSSGGVVERVLSTADDHRNATVCFLADRGGRMWMGTVGAGLFRRERDGSLARFTVADGLPSDTVYSLHEDADGKLWIGTNSGLARLDDDRIADLSRVGELYSGSIFAILEDDASQLWLASPRGVSRVARADLDRVTGADGARVETRLYGMIDGMASSECSGGVFPSASRTRDGRLWFATAKGVAMVDPGNLAINRVPPRVLIERVVVDGLLLNPEAGTELSADSRRLEFHYAAPSFRAVDRMRFRHRLEGFDEQWVDADGRRMANYTNLPAGAYTFRVTAANSDGVWAEAPAELSFRLKPRYWMTPWFAALVVAGLVAAVWALYRQRQRGLEREFSAVLAERTRMAREIHDTLAQGLTGVSIQLEALEEMLTADPESSRRHLDRARDLVRKSLAEARRSVFNLRPALLEGGGLAEALKKVVADLTAETAIQSELRVIGTPRPLPAAVEDNLLRIGQEAVANALRHAAADRLGIELRFEPYEVTLRVSDDGVGFDTKRHTTAAGSRLGLVGLRERAEQMEARLEVRSGRGTGTEITISVPVR